MLDIVRFVNMRKKDFIRTFSNSIIVKYCNVIRKEDRGTLNGTFEHSETFCTVISRRGIHSNNGLIACLRVLIESNGEEKQLLTNEMGKCTKSQN